MTEKQGTRGASTNAARADENIRDVALISRVASGDERAFSDLYERLSPPLYSFVFKILNDARETEDVLQEGFLQIWKKATSFDPDRGSVFSWSVLIMRSRAIDRFRSKARYHRNIDTITEASALQPDHDTNTERELLYNDQRQQLQSALEQIPADQKSAIELAFFSGLTHEEISEKLQEPLGTVKARIRRGLMKLNGFLKRRS